MNLFRTCAQCFGQYQPSSRHKVCPKCRHQNRKNYCPKCSSIKTKYAVYCVECRKQSVANDASQNPNWKGGKTRHQKGYVMILIPDFKSNNGYKFEHILVMENYLGRSLLPGENVHHINGIRDDNRIENLELWTRPQPSGIRAKDALNWAKEIIKLYEEKI